MKIRNANVKDIPALGEVYLSAFPVEENQLIYELTCSLTTDSTTPETFGYVAEEGDTVCGHIAFSPVYFESNQAITGYALAPLAVHPNFQKMGVGSQLVQQGLTRLKERGTNIVLVYGDPKYYGRFGFDADIAEQYSPPYPLTYPFGWQALVLNSFETDGKKLSLTCVEALSDPGLW